MVGTELMVLSFAMYGLWGTPGFQIQSEYIERLALISGL
jgi:hypothetical protein